MHRGGANTNTVSSETCTTGAGAGAGAGAAGAAAVQAQRAKYSTAGVMRSGLNPSGRSVPALHQLSRANFMFSLVEDVRPSSNAVVGAGGAPEAAGNSNSNSNSRSPGTQTKKSFPIGQTYALLPAYGSPEVGFNYSLRNLTQMSW